MFQMVRTAVPTVPKIVTYGHVNILSLMSGVFAPIAGFVVFRRLPIPIATIFGETIFGTKSLNTVDDGDRFQFATKITM